ncbi:NAD(P)-dependent oxidoreductase [Gallalistipes aquisgranensis]|uniref:NAD(P)-dependent oxidoreductase n=1 Tax=Gallalistipes aquisgranensis TaxID=2779358 RepID=UPI001CF8EAF9|nr:NAD(P)-dependent oxidoreductase [Gallalistipes aquisgranensis]MBE5032672.1 dihydrofolate reductase [Gallalistipes aquisgranensis]
MFKKLVAIEPVSLVPSAEKALRSFAEEVILYPDIPDGDEEVARRIGDADAVLLSYTTRLGREALEKCPDVKYIGMCCSLYSPESANVDILYAGERGIAVTGIRDYGDEGVVEYVVSELVRCLHGFGQPAWDGIPREITGLKAGIVGLGKSGGMIADALRFFGAEIAYFARSEKAEARAKGYRFLPLDELLSRSEVVCCCLNKNTVLLHRAEFERLGDRKILFNTGLSPAWDESAFAEWIGGDNLCFCDTLGALGAEKFLDHPHVRCMEVSTGRTRQAFDRLSEKVLANLSEYDRRNDIP